MLTNTADNTIDGHPTPGGDVTPLVRFAECPSVVAPSDCGRPAVSALKDTVKELGKDDEARVSQ